MWGIDRTIEEGRPSGGREAARKRSESYSLEEVLIRSSIMAAVSGAMCGSENPGMYATKSSPSPTSVHISASLSGDESALTATAILP